MEENSDPWYNPADVQWWDGSLDVNGPGFGLSTTDLADLPSEILDVPIPSSSASNPRPTFGLEDKGDPKLFGFPITDSLIDNDFDISDILGGDISVPAPTSMFSDESRYDSSSQAQGSHSNVSGSNKTTASRSAYQDSLQNSSLSRNHSNILSPQTGNSSLSTSIGRYHGSNIQNESASQMKNSADPGYGGNSSSNTSLFLGMSDLNSQNGGFENDDRLKSIMNVLQSQKDNSGGAFKGVFPQVSRNGDTYASNIVNQKSELGHISSNSSSYFPPLSFHLAHTGSQSNTSDQKPSNIWSSTIRKSPVDALMLSSADISSNPPNSVPARSNSGSLRRSSSRQSALYSAATVVNKVNNVYQTDSGSSVNTFESISQKRPYSPSKLTRNLSASSSSSMHISDTLPQPDLLHRSYTNGSGTPDGRSLSPYVASGMINGHSPPLYGQNGAKIVAKSKTVATDRGRALPSPHPHSPGMTIISAISTTLQLAPLSLPAAAVTSKGTTGGKSSGRATSKSLGSTTSPSFGAVPISAALAGQNGVGSSLVSRLGSIASSASSSPTLPSGRLTGVNSTHDVSHSVNVPQGGIPFLSTVGNSNVGIQRVNSRGNIDPHSGVPTASNANSPIPAVRRTSLGNSRRERSRTAEAESASGAKSASVSGLASFQFPLPSNSSSVSASVGSGISRGHSNGVYAINSDSTGLSQTSNSTSEAAYMNPVTGLMNAFAIGQAPPTSRRGVGSSAVSAQSASSGSHIAPSPPTLPSGLFANSSTPPAVAGTFLGVSTNMATVDPVIAAALTSSTRMKGTTGFRRARDPSHPGGNSGNNSPHHLNGAVFNVSSASPPTLPHSLGRYASAGAPGGLAVPVVQPATTAPVLSAVATASTEGPQRRSRSGRVIKASSLLTDVGGAAGAAAVPLGRRSGSHSQTNSTTNLGLLDASSQSEPPKEEPRPADPQPAADHSPIAPGVGVVTVVQGSSNNAPGFLSAQKAPTPQSYRLFNGSVGYGAGAVRMEDFLFGLDEEDALDSMELPISVNIGMGLSMGAVDTSRRQRHRERNRESARIRRRKRRDRVERLEGEIAALASHLELLQNHKWGLWRESACLRYTKVGPNSLAMANAKTADFFRMTSKIPLQSLAPPSDATNVAVNGDSGGETVDAGATKRRKLSDESGLPTSYTQTTEAVNSKRKEDSLSAETEQSELLRPFEKTSIPRGRVVTGALAAGLGLSGSLALHEPADAFAFLSGSADDVHFETSRSISDSNQTNQQEEVRVSKRLSIGSIFTPSGPLDHSVPTVEELQLMGGHPLKAMSAVAKQRREAALAECTTLCHQWTSSVCGSHALSNVGCFSPPTGGLSSASILRSHWYYHLCLPSSVPPRVPAASAGHAASSNTALGSEFKNHTQLGSASATSVCIRSVGLLSSLYSSTAKLQADDSALNLLSKVARLAARVAPALVLDEESWVVQELNPRLSALSVLPADAFPPNSSGTTGTGASATTGGPPAHGIGRKKESKFKTPLVGPDGTILQPLVSKKGIKLKGAAAAARAQALQAKARAMAELMAKTSQISNEAASNANASGESTSATVSDPNVAPTSTIAAATENHIQQNGSDPVLEKADLEILGNDFISKIDDADNPSSTVLDTSSNMQVEKTQDDDAAAASPAGSSVGVEGSAPGDCSTTSMVSFNLGPGTAGLNGSGDVPRFEGSLSSSSAASSNMNTPTLEGALHPLVTPSEPLKPERSAESLKFERQFQQLALDDSFPSSTISTLDSGPSPSADPDKHDSSALESVESEEKLEEKADSTPRSRGGRLIFQPSDELVREILGVLRLSHKQAVALAALGDSMERSSFELHKIDEFMTSLLSAKPPEHFLPTLAIKTGASTPSEPASFRVLRPPNRYLYLPIVDAVLTPLMSTFSPRQMQSFFKWTSVNAFTIAGLSYPVYDPQSFEFGTFTERVRRVHRAISSSNDTNSAVRSEESLAVTSGTSSNGIQLGREFKDTVSGHTFEVSSSASTPSPSITNNNNSNNMSGGEIDSVLRIPRLLSSGLLSLTPMSSSQLASAFISSSSQPIQGLSRRGKTTDYAGLANGSGPLPALGLGRQSDHNTRTRARSSRSSLGTANSTTNASYNHNNNGIGVDDNGFSIGPSSSEYYLYGGGAAGVTSSAPVLTPSLLHYLDTAGTRTPNMMLSSLSNSPPNFTQFDVSRNSSVDFPTLSAAPSSHEQKERSKRPAAEGIIGMGLFPKPNSRETSNPQQEFVNSLGVGSNATGGVPLSPPMVPASQPLSSAEIHPVLAPFSIAPPSTSNALPPFLFSPGSTAGPERSLSEVASALQTHARHPVGSIGASILSPSRMDGQMEHSPLHAVNGNALLGIDVTDKAVLAPFLLAPLSANTSREQSIASNEGTAVHLSTTSTNSTSTSNSTSLDSRTHPSTLNSSNVSGGNATLVASAQSAINHMSPQEAELFKKQLADMINSRILSK